MSKLPFFRMSGRRWIGLMAAVLFASFAPAARADDASAARSVIQEQADALGRDDAGAAYALASPQIQELFPQAELFMSMVQNAYPPVYRHKRFEFGETALMDGKVMQRVGIVDADDVAWEALYTVERQSDGSLKISACVLLKVGTAV